MCMATEKLEEIYQLLKNFEFWKVISITSWVCRFLENCKRKMKLSGPAKTIQAEKVKLYSIKHEQENIKLQTTFN